MAKRKATTEPTTPGDDSESVGSVMVLTGKCVKRERVQFDWPGMVVRGELNLFDAAKGTGKSSVMCHIAVALCGGKRLPEAKSSGPKGKCLWFGSEESFGGTILSRWLAAGGKAEDLLTVADESGTRQGQIVLPQEEHRLRNIVSESGIRVIVADPFTAMCDSAFNDRDQMIARWYLQSLGRVAQEFGVTVLLGRHLTKNRSTSLLNQGMGSVAIPNVCRSALRLEVSKEDRETRYIACVECNAGKAPGVVPYYINPHKDNVATVTFGKRLSLEMEDVVEGEETADERDAIGDARKLLLTALAGGPVDSKTLLKESRDTGIGERTLRKAKAELRIKSKRISAGKGLPANWQWVLPTAK